jgi:2-oxoglutarate dehydrogenase E1 component
MATTLRSIPPSVNGWNAQYLEEQYRAFKADPSSVPPDMVQFFQGFDLAMDRAVASSFAQGSGGAREAVAGTTGPTGAGGGLREALRVHAGVLSLVNAYRAYGHLASKLDPFGRERAGHPLLSPASHGLTEADLATPLPEFGPALTLPSMPLGATIGDLLERLKGVYCGTIGVQYAHIADPVQREWLREMIEDRQSPVTMTREDKLAIFDALVRAEEFERFLQKRYPGDKRFSLEGGESLIPLLERILLTAAENGVEEIVLGMPHRGRLNVLNNILGKTYEQIFTEFEDAYHKHSPDGGGDVKYHKGYSGVRRLRNGKTIHMAMASNPSHLESVGPVVAGRTRAKQRLRGDNTERRRVMGVLLHGDAAVIGQGVVAELLAMSQLEGYRVGGMIHVVVNNQIGFTTLPEDSRSSVYCTDLALSVDAPVFHVNGEDPQAVVAVAHLAVQYRLKFGRDAWIDMYCYRKYGHNEQDEASYTQPVMASLIKAMPGVVSTYGQQLVAGGVISEAKLEEHRVALSQQLDKAQAAARNNPHAPNIDPGGKRWAGFGGAYSHEVIKTGVPRPVLEEICSALARVPEGFQVNPKLTRLLADRAAIPQSGLVNHADAELLAIGSLLLEGHAVRLSGQDARRGTFSQRHAVIRDFKTGEPYVPLNAMRPMPETPDQAGISRVNGVLTQGRFCVYDSPLSEFAVMGFDYGYSLADPNMLVMWEAQFGDFCNGAQTIIDQYIASAEVKWQRWSGLVLLLPHGYEGAGPEHSSARLERFLMLCGNDNIQVVYPSTAAQMFHLLRRQVSPQRRFRKPLIVMTPKGNLRVPTSTFDDLVNGHWHDIIDDPVFERGPGGEARRPDRRAVSRVLLCSGKIYHELAARRDEIRRYDTALVRIEQFYPFNTPLFREILGRYPARAETIWVQEEPRNAGAYLFMRDVLTSEAGLKSLAYIGRPQSATPAVGSKNKSKKEQEAILTEAIGKAPAPKASPDEADHASEDAQASSENGSQSSPRTTARK